MDAIIAKCIKLCQTAAVGSSIPVSTFTDALIILPLTTNAFMVESFVVNTMNVWDGLRTVTRNTAATTVAKFINSLPLTRTIDDVDPKADLVKLFESGNVAIELTLQLVTELHKAVRYTILYVHLERGPVLVTDADGKQSRAYKTGLIGRLNVLKESELWKVNLTFK